MDQEDDRAESVEANQRLLTCKLCGGAFTPDQLVLRPGNEGTALCEDNGLFHQFADEED